MEPSIFRMQDAEKSFGLDGPSPLGVRNSEFGIRSPFSGIRSPEFGIRSSEFALRNGSFPSLRESVRDWEGTFAIPDSRCGRSLGLEGSSRFGIWNSSFGMEAFAAPEASA